MHEEMLTYGLKEGTTNKLLHIVARMFRMEKVVVACVPIAIIHSSHGTEEKRTNIILLILETLA